MSLKGRGTAAVGDTDVNGDQYILVPPPRYGLAAVLAMCAAIASVVLSFVGRPGAGLALGIVSLPLGLVGWVRAVSPEIRGGLTALLAMFLGLAGIVLALIVMVFKVALWSLWCAPAGW